MRFLFVSHSLPYPPTNGGNQRTALMLRALSELGEVDLLLMHGEREPEPEVMEHIRQHYNVLACLPMPRRAERGAWRWIQGIHPRMVSRLAHHFGRDAVHYRPHPRVAPVLDQALGARPYDLIVGRYLKPTALSGALRYTPVLLDVDDLDYTIWRSRLETPGQSVVERFVVRHHLRQLQRAVPPLLARCTHLWTTSEADRSELNALPVSLLPNIPFSVPSEPAPLPTPPSPMILTVASFVQERNRAGVDHFVRNVWPLVRARVPDATYRIVGSGLSPELRAQWAAVPGVDPVGFVEDLSSAYASCTFTAAPLFFGGGSNIKILESLSFRRTCVTTPFALRGIGENLRHGEALLAAEGPDDMAAACIRLLQRPELARSLAEHGARSVAEHYSYERFRRGVREGVTEALRGGGGVKPNPSPANDQTIRSVFSRT